MNAKSIAGLILLALFIIVCIQNVESIPIHFLFWSFNISKLLLLILTFMIGIGIGFIFYTNRSKNEDKKIDESSKNEN